MELKFPWGKHDVLNIAWPQGWDFKGEILPKNFPPAADIKKILCEALDNPVDQVPLSCRSLSGAKIAIIIDDNSRPTPVHLVFPEVYQRLLAAGAQKGSMTIVIALGTHSPLRHSEICTRLGMKIDGFTIVNHDCRNDSMLCKLGKTVSGLEVCINKHVYEADFIISVGTIEPHLLAGFGGGLKNLIPGCAGKNSIAATHLMGPASQRFSGVGKMGEECPTRFMIEEGARMVPGEIFLVNTVLNQKGEIVGLFCGDPVKAHRDGCRLAARIYGSLVEEKADVVITGSHPMDIDLRQGTKCLANASGVLKDDGLLIALMRCCHGIGDMKIPDYFLPFDAMRIFSQECGTEKVVGIRERIFGAMSMDEKYMLEFLTEMSKRHHILVYAPTIPSDTGIKLGTFELFSDIDVLFKRATQLVPQAKVAYSLPYGGVSYALCPERCSSRNIEGGTN